MCEEEISTFYQEFFNPDAVDPWEKNPDNPDTDYRLEKPVTVEEFEEALQKLKNGRACGKDNITGELLKYGGISLANQMAIIINQHAHQLKSWCKGYSFL
jgi:hypothetical protein